MATAFERWEQTLAELAKNKAKPEDVEKARIALRQKVIEKARQEDPDNSGMALALALSRFDNGTRAQSYRSGLVKEPDVLTEDERSGVDHPVLGGIKQAAKELVATQAQGWQRIAGSALRLANDFGENEKGTWLDRAATSMEDAQKSTDEFAGEGYATADGIRGFGKMGLQNAPILISTYLTGGAVGGATSLAGRAAGLAKTAQGAAKVANAARWAGAGGAAAAGFSGEYGDARQQTLDKFKDITPEQLRESEKYAARFKAREKELYLAGAAPEDAAKQAYEETVDALSETDANIVGVVNSMIEFVAPGASKFFLGGGKLSSKSLANAKKFANLDDVKDVSKQFGQEFLQEGFTSAVTDDTRAKAVNGDVNWGQVGKDALVGGTLGAIMGGGAQFSTGQSTRQRALAEIKAQEQQQVLDAQLGQAAQARKAELDAIRQQRPLTPEEQEDADVADAILARNAPEGQPEGEQQPPVQDGQPLPQPTPDPAAGAPQQPPAQGGQPTGTPAPQPAPAPQAGAPIVVATPPPAGAPVGSNIPQPPEPPQPAPGLSGVVQRHTQSAAPALDTVFGDAIKGNQVPDFTGLAQQTGLDRNSLVDQFNAKRTEHVRKQGLMDLAEQGDLNALRSAVSGITVDPQQQDQLIEEAVSGNEQRKAEALAASQQQGLQAQQQAQQAAQQQADKDKYDQTYGKMLGEAVAALEGGQTEVKAFLPIKKKYSASGLNASDVNGVIEHAKQVIAEKQQKAARHEQAVTEAMPHLQSGDEASAVLAMEQAGVTDDADVQSVLKEANKRIRQDSKKPAGTQSVPAVQPADPLASAVAEVKAAQASGKKLNLATIAKKHGVPILDVAKGATAKPEQEALKAKPSQPLALPAPQGTATPGDVMVSRNGKVMSQAEADALDAAANAEKKQMRRDMAEEAGNPTGIPTGMKPKVEKPARTEQKAVLPHLILRTDGKPFPDEKQANRVLASKKLTETHEVVSVEGGKAISPKKAVTAKNQVDPEKDDILAAIAKLGGIDRAQAKSQGIDPADFSRRAGGIHFVFRKNGGKELDRMAEALSEMGYPVTENGDYTINALLDALDAALRGSAVGTPMFHEAKAQAMYEEEAAQREIDAMFDSPGNSAEPDWLSFGADDFVSSILDGDITPNAVIASELAGIENERTVTGTLEAAGQKVDANPAPSSGAKGIAAAAGGGTEWQQKGKGDSQPDSAVQDFGLKAQTESERLAEEQRQAADLEAKHQADEAVRLKAQADREISSFTLTGSDLPADVAMAAGQKDLFAPRTRGEKAAEKNQPRSDATISDADYAQVVEAAKYLKDIVYSMDNLVGDDTNLLIALSSDLGKSGRDTILMDAFGIDRSLAHTINNRLDDRKPHKLRAVDMGDAFTTFPMLRKVVDDAKDVIRKREERRSARDAESKTASQQANDAATDTAESKPEPVKWFGSRDKADAWIAKNGPDYHVVQAGPSRFEVFAGKEANAFPVGKDGLPARKSIIPKSTPDALLALTGGDQIVFNSGTEFEETVWIEENRARKTWVIKTRSGRAIITEGPVGPDRQWGWGKNDAAAKAVEGKYFGDVAAKPNTSNAASEDLDSMFDDVLEEVTGKPKAADIPKASVESAFTGDPDPKNSAPMQELDGFAVGDKVSIANRSVSEGVIRQLFTRQSAGSEMRMARVEVAGGKTLDLLTDNLSRQERTASQAAVSAAKNTGMALGDAIDGLGKLFGGNKLSSGLTFDEDTYAKAKPYFIAAISHLRAAGGDLREAMRAVVKMVVDKFGADAAGNMKPYVVQFIADVRDGKIDDPAATLKGSDTNEDADNDVRKLDTTGQGALEGVSSGQVQVAGEGRGTGSGTTEGGRGDGGADGSVAGARSNRDGGVGNSSERVPVSGAGAGGSGRGRSRSSGRAGRAVSAQLSASNEQESSGGLTADASQPSMALEPGRIDPPQLTEDFIIEDDLGLGEGGQRTKYKNNVEAIRLIRDLEATGRTATTDEQKALAKYVGWGGIPQAFDPDNKDWSAQYAELKSLLSADEWDAAFESTQYAHYTSREIINGMYAAVRRLGFNGGNVLEAGGGVGNFIGLMPVDLRTNGKVTLVEREAIAAAIAKHLYPRQNIRAEDFTEFGKGQDGQYDMQIGNPPFSSNPLTDKSGRKHLTGLSVHNYFITKGVDMLRDGGIMAVVVSNSFMDAGNVRAREYIAKRAKLLGAIRLPNNAFSKNANTQVTTDIIFLQKLPESDWNSKAAIADGKRWVGVTTVSDPQGKGEVALNQYFADNMGMMLGVWGKFGTMYGPDQPALVARPGQDTAAMMARAVAALPEGVYTPASVSRTKAMEGALLEKLHDNSVGEGGFYVKDGKVWQRVADSVGEAYAAEITPNTVISGTRSIGQLGIDRLRQLAELRRTMRELLAAETEDRKADMDRLRKELNTRYDAYTADNGRINDPTTKRLMRDDPDYPLIAALEMDYEPGIGPAAAKAAGIKPQTSKAKKAAIFDRRVIEARKAVTKADSPQDAINISMAERGRLDAEYIGRLLDVPGDEVLGQLASGTNPLLFRDPATDEYVLRDAYLSGNVREKLKQAKAAGLTSNARALEEVQPEDIPASKVSVRIGSPWVPVSVYADFASNLFGEGTKTILRYVKSSGGFSGVIIPGSEVMASTKFGTKSYHGDAILLALMNNRQIKVMTKDGDGKPTVDAKATEEANSKADDIKQAFQDWIFKDADRAEVLLRAYNDANNNYVVRKYDGSWLKFPGKVPDAVIRFRRHQRNAIARTIQDRTTLYDHVVGAGKTFTAIASAMEMRRMGLVRKPLMVVPNHLVGQWASDFYRLYPGAKVLAATKKDFERENRRRFLAKIASGDWDAVIIAHSSFGHIRPNPEFEQKFTQAEIDRIMREAKEVEASVGDEQEKKRTVKQLAAMQERLENRIAKLREKPMDDLLDFQQLGVDQVFVDEAHLFKNLMFTTKMQNVRGLGDPTGSQRAYDMYIKTSQIMEQNGRGQGVVFMTGTPVSNSLAEMYHMMRYLMPDQMRQLGFESFDAWANTYAEAKTMFVPKTSGDGFKQQTRLSSFSNVYQLLAMSDQVTDTVTMDDIKAAHKEETGKDFPLPKLLTGRRQPVSLDKTPAQEAYMKDIVDRLNKLESRKGPPKKGEDNHLTIMSDARKAAMDIRLVDMAVIDREKGARVDRASNEIFARWKKYDAERGTQLVFADLGTPIASVKNEVKEYDAIMARIAAGEDPDVIARAQLGDEEAAEKVNDAENAQESLDAKGRDWLTAIECAKRGFSVYDDMKKALMEKGIPESQIAFIHSYNTDDQKAALFRKVNNGEIRILMGSTPKMGAGTNVQKRLVALHHLDVPWKPSDLEQREGRIIRQGNVFATEPTADAPNPEYKPDFEVEILAYVTKDTLDAFMWNIQEAKLKGINQLRSRNIDDELSDAFEEMEMSAGEMQAAATGNMDMLREIQLRTEVQKLEKKQRAFDAGKADAIAGIRRATREVERLPAQIATYERLSKASEDVLLDVFTARNKFKATINGKEYSSHTEAAKVLRDLVDAVETGEDGKERKAKLDVTMNGEQFTNRQKLAEAFARLTGDNEPFVFDAGDGKVYRIDDAADAVMDTVASARDSEGEKLLGGMGDYKVSIEYGVEKLNQDEVFEVHASLGDDDLPSAVVRAKPGDDRHTAKEILKTVRDMVRDAGSALGSLKSSLEKAKKNLADLSEIDTTSEWPDSEKLARMRDEHRRLRNKINRNDGSLSYDVSFFLAEQDSGMIRVVGESGNAFSGQPAAGFSSETDAGEWIRNQLMEKISKDYKEQGIQMRLIRRDSRAYGAPEYIVTHGSQVYEPDGEYYDDRESASSFFASWNDTLESGVFTGKKKPASPVSRLKGERMDPIPDYLFSAADTSGPALTTTSAREILAADPVLSKAMPFIELKSATENIPAGAAKFLPAYHASPFKFDKFSLDHMGKGEGAQAYGWGLYFAESKAVADWYRQNLSSLNVGTGEVSFRGKVYDFSEGSDSANDLVSDLAGYYGVSRRGASGAVVAMREHLGVIPAYSYFTHAMENKTKDQKETHLLLTLLRNDQSAPPKGQLYQVDIPEDGTYLLWDKPLSEQPEYVRRILADKRTAKAFAKYAIRNKGLIDAIGSGELEGWQAYQSLVIAMGNQEKASKFLGSIGISGIKFLDGSSRGAGEGSYNYVVFDDKAVRILETYYSAGKSGGPEGYYHNGKITLFPENIKATPTQTAEERLKWVAFHEVTHRGVANLSESLEYMEELRQAGKNPFIKNLAKKIHAKRQGTPYEVSMEVAIEEALAETWAALQTGSSKTIKAQYGLHFPLSIRPRAKSAIARFFEAVKRIYNKLTGRGLTNEQVGDLLRKTHEAGMGPGDGPKGGKKFSADSSGDQKVRALFRKVQDAQRFGKGVNGVAPELAFDSRYNPHVDLSGAFATMAEHIGDLVHRAAMPPDENEAGSGIGPGGANYGVSALREKVERNLHKVARGDVYDFQPQARRNAEWALSPEQMAKKQPEFSSEAEAVILFRAAAQRYADSYKQIPVYTELQKLSRDAAIALGELRSADLRVALEKIDAIVSIDPRSKKASQARAMESYFALLPDAGNDSGTINIDGKDRPTTNSTGKPIATTEADIRYSAPPTPGQPPSRSVFASVAKQWMFQKWTETLGTQLNTAMLEPLFKPTYDLVQRYLQHTSNDAYDAISVAPNLLGRLEDINDYGREIKNIGKFKKINADRDAAAVPLFEGTRFDKKVYSDAVLKRVYNLTDDQVAVYREARAAIEASLDSHAKSVITKILLDAGAVEFSDIDMLVNRDLPADDYMEELRQRMDADILAANDAIAIQKTALSAAGVTAQDKASIQASIKKGSRRVELLEEAAKRIDSTEDTLSQLKHEGYFPLMRWGKYTVTVKDAGGNVVDFRMVETLREKAALSDALTKQYQGQGMTVTSGTMDEGRFKDFRGISPETLALFAKELGVDNDEAYQEYLKLALPGQSALKRRIHRKGDNGEGIAGFSMDIQRTLAAFVMGNARHSARNIYGSAITKSVDTIPGDRGDVRGLARNLAEFVTQPDENSASVSIRNMLFVWNMGASVAFGALNLTQPWMMTLPWLSQFSGIGSVVELMGKAAKTAAIAQKNGTVPQEYYAEYQQAVREGHVDPQNVFMLQGIERGGSGLGSSLLKTVSHGMGMIAAATESYNRKLTLFAALDVARAKGLPWLKSKGFDSAYAFAVQAVAETQGVYNKGNRPTWARGPIGAVLLVFKQYAVNWIEMAVRMGRNHYGEDRMRKGLMMMLGLLFAMAGAMGMPGAEDLKDIAETAMGSAGKPVNIERQMQMTLGKGVADAVMAGPMNILVLNSIGLDMHGRMSMGNIIPGTGAFNPYTSTDAKLSEGISVMGAGTGLLKKGSDAVAAAQDGRFLDAAQSAAPRAIESVMKGVRMMAEGKARDARGNVLMETTPWDAAAKIIDFQPASVAITQRERGRRFQDKNIQMVARASLRNRLITAYEEKDADKIRDAEQALDEWNQDNPLYQVKLKKRDLRRAAKKRGSSWMKREETPKGLEWMDEYADQENGQ